MSRFKPLGMNYVTVTWPIRHQHHIGYVLTENAEDIKYVHYVGYQEKERDNSIIALLINHETQAVSYHFRDVVYAILPYLSRLAG